MYVTSHFSRVMFHSSNPIRVPSILTSIRLDPYPFWCHLPCPNLHGRKGLPISARRALLDTRMMKYQHACFGTIETTLNVGTIFTTLYPNFCMSLKDNRLFDALKIQLQIVGVDQDPWSIRATLRYQMAYQIQNHAINLPLLTTTNALMIFVDSTLLFTVSS